MMLEIKAVLMAAAFIELASSQEHPIEYEDSPNYEYDDYYYNYGEGPTTTTTEPFSKITARPAAESPITEEPQMCQYIQREQCVHTIIKENCIQLCASQACGTESKCGLEGGFCIAQDEYCNGNVIQREGYCSNNGSCKCCLTPTVYMRDIENTISYTLWNIAPFIPGGGQYRTKLNATELTALSNFVKALINHLPLRTPVKDFLMCVNYNITEIVVPPINGRVLKDIYYYCVREEKGEFPEYKTWIGCRNTNNFNILLYRSYPCGLWITMHAMTVNLASQKAPHFLPTILDFMTFFPFCTDCRSHFQKMYKELDGKGMKTPEDVTMWLWRAHNLVNVQVADGFNGPNNTSWENTACKYISPMVKGLQTLLSVCKFRCKMQKNPKDCKYIELPVTVPIYPFKEGCKFCKARQRGAPKVELKHPTKRYSLNTATQTPGQRKSLFPEFQLCKDCWELANENFTFTTVTNDEKVLNYLHQIYSADAIVPDPMINIQEKTQRLNITILLN